MREPDVTRPVLRTEGLTKSFGAVRALSAVSLPVMPGRIHAIVGENGAGKSTLVNIIAGVIQPDAGTILLDDALVRFRGPLDAARRGVHMVHQELSVLPQMTVSENVFLGQETRNRFGFLDKNTMQRRAAAVLAELRADISPQSRVATLSVASRQMVEIAKALAGQSRILILDEPTAALSPEEAERMFAVLRRLAAAGTAILHISHRLSEVLAIADEITVLKDGTHVITRSAAELTMDEVTRLMVGREMGQFFPEKPPPTPRREVLSVAGLMEPPRVNGVDLSLGTGEIVGVFGLEGHGQDELLACLAGDRAPVRGTLRVNGEQRPWTDVAGMIDYGVGYVPPDRRDLGLLLDLDTVRNITLPLVRTHARFGTTTSRREARMAAPAAEQAGVRGDIRKPVATLSGGNQQKVLLARWIAAGSRVLLLNQPTRGVDVGSKAEIYRVIRGQCREQHATAVVVSPEILELVGLCDRVLVMHAGRIVGEAAANATEEEVLAMAVGGTR
ncbi:MAG: sugar ABC transporter ATP-binding protein [Acidimicrobiales bacterium]